MVCSLSAKRLLLVVLVGAMTYVSCRDADEIADGNMIITGTVTDSVTGMPIDSALVDLDDTSHAVVAVYTDMLGEYQIDLLASASHVVYCRKNGYRTKWIVVPKPAGVPFVKDVDFQLTP